MAKNVKKIAYNLFHFDFPEEKIMPLTNNLTELNESNLIRKKIHKLC